MTGLEAVDLGRLYGAAAVEVSLFAVSVGYAAYLYRDRQQGGDYGPRAPMYTAIGTAFTAAAHLALMLILWPLVPLEVTALLILQFAISGLPVLAGRELERRAQVAARAREAETDAVALRARLDTLRMMNHD